MIVEMETAGILKLAPTRKNNMLHSITVTKDKDHRSTPYKELEAYSDFTGIIFTIRQYPANTFLSYEELYYEDFEPAPIDSEDLEGIYVPSNKNVLVDKVPNWLFNQISHEYIFRLLKVAYGFESKELTSIIKKSLVNEAKQILDEWNK